MADRLLTEACEHLRLLGDHHLVGGAGLHLAALCGLHPVDGGACDHLLYFAASCESGLFRLFGGLGAALAVGSPGVENGLSVVLDGVGLDLSSLELLTGTSL